MQGRRIASEVGREFVFTRSGATPPSKPKPWSGGSLGASAGGGGPGGGGERKWGSPPAAKRRKGFGGLVMGPHGELPVTDAIASLPHELPEGVKLDVPLAAFRQVANELALRRQHAADLVASGGGSSAAAATAASLAAKVKQEPGSPQPSPVAAAATGGGSGGGGGATAGVWIKPEPGEAGGAPGAAGAQAPPPTGALQLTIDLTQGEDGVDAALFGGGESSGGGGGDSEEWEELDAAADGSGGGGDGAAAGGEWGGAECSQWSVWCGCRLCVHCRQGVQPAQMLAQTHGGGCQRTPLSHRSQ